jgi:hypothetical protein
MRGESDIGWLAPVSNTSVGMHTGVCCTGAASSAPLVPFHGGLREITTHRSAYESLAGRSIAVGRSGALYARCSSPEPRRHRPRGSAHRPALTSYRRRGPAATHRRGRARARVLLSGRTPAAPGDVAPETTVTTGAGAPPTDRNGGPRSPQPWRGRDASSSRWKHRPPRPGQMTRTVGGCSIVGPLMLPGRRPLTATVEL